MNFLELYSLGVPLFLPEDLHMWAFCWTFSDPSVMEDKLADSVRAEGNVTWNHPFAPYCATRGLRRLDPAACAYWAGYSDLVRMPHLEYFKSFPDLLAQLLAACTETLLYGSQAMRAFQTASRAAVVDFWREALGGLLLANTSRSLETGR
eukprot:UN2174